MFSFFGLFSRETPGLLEDMATRWPSSDVTRLEEPFQGLALRYSSDLYTPSDEDIPAEIATQIIELSTQHPTQTFVVVRTECWGGSCMNWGTVCQNGRAEHVESQDGALR